MSKPHKRHEEGPSPSPEPPVESIPKPAPVEVPGSLYLPSVEVHRDRPRADPARVPPEFQLPEQLEVYRDTNEGRIPVEAHATARPKPRKVEDVAAGYQIVEPHHAQTLGSASGEARIRVMTTGVFDLIHVGHVLMLEAAKKLGDELVVVIARDETVRRQKHEPITTEETRRRIVESLKPVDRAILGRQGDIYQIVKEIQPDVIALGHDQTFKEDEVRRRCAEVGVAVRVVRLPQFDQDLDATRKIIDRIGERIARNELYTREARRHE